MKRFDYTFGDPLLDDMPRLHSKVGRYVSSLYPAEHFPPRFIPEGDVQTLWDTIEHVHGAGHVSFASSMFTVFPHIDVAPIEEKDRTRGEAVDAIGFRTLTAPQVLVRANMSNVVSCHSFFGGNAHEGCNLAYIGNPSWGTLGFYKAQSSRATYRHGANSLPAHILEGLPNLVATCNMCIGLDDSGHLSALISRFYGDYTVNKVRLVEYVTNILRLNLYAIKPNTPNWSAKVNFPALDGVYTTVAYGLPFPAQVVTKDASVLYRYYDIEHPRTGVFNKTTCITERHSVYPIKMADYPIVVSDELHHASKEWTVIQKAAPHALVRQDDDPRYEVCANCKAKESADKLTPALVSSLGDYSLLCDRCCKAICYNIPAIGFVRRSMCHTYLAENRSVCVCLKEDLPPDMVLIPEPHIPADRGFPLVPATNYIVDYAHQSLVVYALSLGQDYCPVPYYLPMIKSLSATIVALSASPKTPLDRHEFLLIFDVLLTGSCIFEVNKRILAEVGLEWEKEDGIVVLYKIKTEAGRKPNGRFAPKVVSRTRLEKGDKSDFTDALMPPTPIPVDYAGIVGEIINNGAVVA